MIQRSIACVLLTVAFGSRAFAAKEVYNFKAGVETRAEQGLAKDEIAPVTGAGGFFTWTYTFFLYLDDGSSSRIQFTFWKLYLLTHRGIYFSFMDKGKTHYQGNNRDRLLRPQQADHTAERAGKGHIRTQVLLRPLRRSLPRLHGPSRVRQ